MEALQVLRLPHTRSFTKIAIENQLMSSMVIAPDVEQDVDADPVDPTPRTAAKGRSLEQEVNWLQTLK